MIQNLNIKNFKAIEETSLDLKPLTILTGLNSSGKSSCIQAILASLYFGQPSPSFLILENNSLGLDFSLQSLRNRSVNAKSFSVAYDYNGCANRLEVAEDRLDKISDNILELEENLFYLNANRLAFQNIETTSKMQKIGLQGEYAFGTFESEKQSPVIKELQILDDSSTLQSHVNHWLSKISGIPFEVKTEFLPGSSTQVKTLYKSDGLSNISPAHLGVGISSIAKVLIMCLRAKKGDVIIIENPELHLHPHAQAMMGEFLAYIANAGIQVIVETHCEHIINRVQYETFSGNIKAQDVVIFYKPSLHDDFITISLRNDGKFQTDFPEGFFDATLNELIEME